MDKLNYGEYDNTITGADIAFRATNGYSNTTSESETRKQLSYPLKEIKDFVNNTVTVDSNDKAVQLQVDSNGFINYRSSSDDDWSAIKRNVWYGTCDTKNGDKIVTTTSGDFSLETGSVVLVKFTNITSYYGSSATMNVDNTGAVTLLNAEHENNYFHKSYEVVPFIYDGTNFVAMKNEIRRNFTSSVAVGTTTAIVSFYTLKANPDLHIEAYILDRKTYKKYTGGAISYSSNPTAINRGTYLTVTLQLSDVATQNVYLSASGDLAWYQTGGM